jgi:integrase
MLNLTWADINFESHEIRVVSQDRSDQVLAWEPKDHECRTIPVPSEVVRLLVNLQTESEEGCSYVFLPKWRWLHVLQQRRKGNWAEDKALVNNIGRGLDQLRHKAGISAFTLHDLRRSCITNWARELPVHVVQKLAGHSDIKTTQKYYLIVQQENMEKARIVNSKILGPSLIDPLLTHSGQIRPPTKKAAEHNFPAAKDLR